MDPVRLRKIAAWLDTSDRLLSDAVDELREEGRLDEEGYYTIKQFLGGTEMQDDLRKWADELEAGGEDTPES